MTQLIDRREALRWLASSAAGTIMPRRGVLRHERGRIIFDAGHGVRPLPFRAGVEYLQYPWLPLPGIPEQLLSDGSTYSAVAGIQRRIVLFDRRGSDITRDTFMDARAWDRVEDWLQNLEPTAQVYGSGIGPCTIRSRCRSGHTFGGPYMELRKTVVALERQPILVTGKEAHHGQGSNHPSRWH